MYIHYLSIKTEGTGFLHWECNYAGTAYSDDGGQDWIKDPPQWIGDSNFAQVAMVQQGSFTYIFGVPCVNPGRGDVHLARVPSDSLLIPAQYQYWTGKTWSPDITAAKTIVPCCVQQFSVRYNSYYKKWIMMGTGWDLRTADTLTGPWSQPVNIFPYGASTRSENCMIYAPMITPSWNNGPDIWFNMSNINVYDVSLWHTSLTPVGAPSAPRSPKTAAPIPARVGPRSSLGKLRQRKASPITGYVVTAYYSTDPSYEERFSLPPVTFKSIKTTETITGLTSGTAYTFKIAAINKTGIGPQSVASKPVTAT